MEPSVIKCPSCGTTNPSDVRICQKCGAQLLKPKAAVAAKKGNKTQLPVEEKKSPSLEPLKEETAPPKITEDQRFSYKQPSPIQVYEARKRKKLLLFIGLGVLALVILAVIILLITKGSNKPTTSASVDSPTNSQPTPLAVKTKISSTDGMVMVYVPAGEFLMGSKDDVGNGNEHPQHTVSLDAYWIDQTEVTNAMYEKCVTAGVCTDLGSNASNTRKEYFGNAAYADYPVIFVNWYQAQAYCKWAARELPTEAQWEKAARGTDGEAYPWGNETPTKDIANYNANKGDTTKVGSYAAGASPYGAYDMAGNVWEWVADKYDEQYYSSSPASNPTGAASGKYQILRGGSWYNLGTDIRSAYRSGVSPSVFYYDTGFRCALN